MPKLSFVPMYLSGSERMDLNIYKLVRKSGEL